MNISRFNEPQHLGILNLVDSGAPVTEFCWEHGMSSASFYKWRSKYGCMDALLISQMKTIDDENRRLMKIFVELSIQSELLKEAMGKN